MDPGRCVWPTVMQGHDMPALHNGDCLEVLKLLPEGSVDMVLTDPPYGITRNAWDRPVDWKAWWDVVERVTKPNAAVVVFSSGMHTAELMLSNARHWRYNLVWTKNKATGFYNANKMPLRAHEDIVVFYRQPPVYHPQKSQGHKPMGKWERGSPGSGYGSCGQSATNAGTTERHPTSVLSFAVLNNDSKLRVHPSQKPVPLLEHLIRTYTDDGNLVLDTFAGSGSTGVACLATGRRCLLIEKDSELYATMCRHVKGSDGLAKVAPGLAAKAVQ